MTFSIIAIALWLGTAAFAGTQTSSNYQLIGGNTNGGGVAAITGTASITFEIFDAATGGAPLWTETHPGVAVLSIGKRNCVFGNVR